MTAAKQIAGTPALFVRELRAVGLITGSIAGLITGSIAGLITGSIAGLITGSIAGLDPSCHFA